MKGNKVDKQLIKGGYERVRTGLWITMNGNKRCKEQKDMEQNERKQRAS